MHRPLARLALLIAACSEPAEPGDDAPSTSSTSSAATTTGDMPTTTDPPLASTGDDDGSGTGGATTGSSPGCDGESVIERGFFTASDAPTSVALTRCGEDRWYFAAPVDSTLEISLTRTDGAPVTAVIAYPDEPDVWSTALADPLTSHSEPASRIFPVPRSGEFAIHVDTLADADASYDLAIRCILGCERETTRFPVVLVHGWTGWSAIGPLTYFYDVKDDLESLGYPLHVVQLDPYNHTNVRAAQLGDQLDAVLPLWHARKVDLIGHSQGGIDSRAVISTYGYGDRVSALITIASPHRGTFIADAGLGLAPGPLVDVAGLLLNFLGAVTAQQKSDALASFESLSEQHMVGTFNPHNPDDERVEYISYTGRTCDALDFLDADLHCQDLVDPLIGWSYEILKSFRGANDGLVTVDSAMWGDYRGEMIADHIDEVGQVLGVTDPKFDHLQFYRDRARELADAGH